MNHEDAMAVIMLLMLFVGFVYVFAKLVDMVEHIRHGAPDTKYVRFKSIRIGGEQFQFRYERLSSGKFQIQALIYPALGNSGFSRSPHKTHIYSEGRICVANPPRELDKAKAIARFWATGYLSYRTTGVFPNSGGKIRV